jgi:hypothetical protein
MTASKYEKYLVREPLWEAAPGIKKRQSPTMTFMSGKQVPEANYYIEFGWIYDIPEPNPHIHEHAHKFDEIVLHVGGDPENPEDLGGEIEFYVGGQSLTFTTTTGVFIPAGVPHGPLTWKKVTRPHIEMAIMLGTGNVKEGWAESGIKKAKDKLPEKTDDVDYEKYLVRKPIYEAGRGLKKRQSPTMTLMSRAQVPEADYYIELGWIYDIPEPNPHIHEHVHRYDEIVLHWGGDPENPLDLGGEIEFCVGGDPLTFNTTTGLWLPKGVKHGPLTWKKFQGPHIEMAFMLGAGSLKEGWKGSGITGRKK